MKNEIKQQIFEKMKAKDFGESMCNETKLNVLKWMMQQLRKHDVSDSLPSDKLEKSLGDTKRKFTLWHDGGEWLISLKGKEQEQCKTLREWLIGNDR